MHIGIAKIPLRWGHDGFLDSAGWRWCPCGRTCLSTHPRGHTIRYL